MPCVNCSCGECNAEEKDIEARSSEERTKAMEVIRAFRDISDLVLEYRCTAPNPYKDDDSKLVEIYNDDRGNEYWIDPSDNTLTQAGPSARLSAEQREKTRTEDRLTVSELRNKAVSVISAQIKDFTRNRSSYSGLEDNSRKECYFFRWDDFSQPAKESELPPFVQVGLYANGELASYTNTLVK